MGDNKHISQKVKSLYDVLKSNGEDVGSEQEFNDWFLKPGQEGYKNRKYLWDMFNSHGADVGANYEEFAGWLGLRPASQSATSPKAGQQTLVASGAKPLGGGVQGLIESGGWEPASAVSEDTKAATYGSPMAVNAWLSSLRGQAAHGTRNFNERSANLLEHAKKNPLGRNTVKSGFKYNKKTGDFEQTYVTPYGTRHTDKAEADEVSRQWRDANDHSIEKQIGEAYREQERLEREIEARGKEIEQGESAVGRAIRRGVSGAIAGSLGGAVGKIVDNITNPSDYIYKRTDETYNQLVAASNANKERIKTLEAARDKGGFWRSAINATTDPNTWLFGVPGLVDAATLYTTSKKLEKNGGDASKLTEAEKSMLDNVIANSNVQGEYGDDFGFMYRAGAVTASALPFAAEFVATGGFSGIANAGARIGEKLAAKAATKGITSKASQWLIKNTGVAAGDIASSIAMANTTGAARTASDILGRHMGDATIDEKGNYTFKSGEDLATAAANGVVSNTLEYYTEKLGGHLQLGKWLSKGAEKVGLSKLSKAINYASSNKWLEKGGVQDYPSEVLEEEANIVLNSLLVGDNKFSDLWDAKTQADIWGGMAFSLGFMNAPKYANTGYQAAQYYRYKHKTDKSDAAASSQIGAEQWQELKEKIDGADNERISDILNTEIIGNDNLNPESRKAAMDYAKNLLEMRGYNMGLLNSVKDDISDKEEDGNKVVDTSVGSSYTEGYNAADETEAATFEMEYGAARENAEQAFDEETLALLDDNPVYTLSALRSSEEFTDEALAIAVDYVNAKAARDGAEQRMADDLDSEIDAARGEVMQRINGDDFMIHGAQMKADNADGTPKRVHIISGNVSMREDGSVDTANSSQTIVVRDAATGKVEMVSPEHIRSVDEAIDPQEEYSNAEAAARVAYEEKKARIQAATEAEETEQPQTETPQAEIKGKEEQAENQQIEEEQGNPPQIKPQTESENLQTETQTEAEQAAAESPIVQQEEIPVEKDKRGNVVRTLYHKVPMQRTLEDLYDGSLDQEEIDRFVENLAADAKRRLASVENEKKPQIGSNKRAYLEAKRLYEEKLADTRAEVEYYDNLQKEVLRVTQRGGQQTGVSEDLGGEPLSLEELAARFASEYKVTPESLKGETGMSGKELKGFVGLVAKEENGGVSIERLGELLARSDEWAQLGGTPEMTQEARNMLIDAYMSGNPRSYVKQQRERFAQREAEHEMNEIENFAQAAFGMSAEEYLAYEEQAFPAIMNKYAGFDFDIYYAILQEQADARANEAEANYNNSINGNTNEQQGESNGNGGSGGILQEEWTADEQGGRTSDEQESGGQGSVGNAGLQGVGTQGTVGEDAPEPLGEKTNNGDVSDSHGRNKKIEEAKSAALERRKADGIQQDDAGEAGGGAGEEAGNGEKKNVGGGQKNVGEHSVGRVSSTESTGGDSAGGSDINEEFVPIERQIIDPRAMSDEERQKRGDLLRNATEIDVTPNQIVSTKNKTARNAAEEWWDNHVGEAKWYETEVGEVEINRNSVESSLAHGYGQMKLDAITSLVDGFSNAVYLGTMPDSTRQNGVLNHYFAYPIKYNDKRCYVFCRALHDNNTNRLCVHEVFVEDKIKKGNTLQTAASQPHGGIALYRDILANVLISDGKVTEKENSVQTSIANAEQETDTDPSEAQKKAGNYKKGHVKIDGFDVTIENPKGSMRRGTDADGKQWEQEMHNTYGYILGTEGVDGDHIDVFLSDNPANGDVFVVDQVNKDGTFDEHKVMYGFASEEEARNAYLSNYEDGWTGLGAITRVSKEEFKKWVDSSHRKTKPFAEYKGVKKTEATDNAEASNSTRSAFDNLKKKASGRMLIFKEGGNYEILYEDAKKAAEILEFPVQKKDGKTFVSFPIKDLYKNLPLLIREGVMVAITDELVKTKNQKAEKAEVPGMTEVPGSDAGKTAVSVIGSMLSEEESARLSELRAKDRKSLEKRELEEMLALERKERILREGTYYDKPFGLKPVREISSAEDVEENIAKIIKGLKTNEGDGRFKDFEGFSYGGNYDKNAGRQIDEYLQALIDVIPFDITKAWCESHGLETHDDVYSYGESLYKAEKTEGTEADIPVSEVNQSKDNGNNESLETIKRQAEREGGHILILPSESSEEAGGLSGRTPDLSSDGKVTEKNNPAQQGSKETDKEEGANGGKGKKASDTKIDDVGERLEGARKDMRRKIAESLANVTEADLIEKPFGKVYKKPDLKKAVESGALREKDAIFYEALFSMVDQQKPKVTQRDMRSKRYIPDYKTKAERWAADTFKQMEVLRQFMELDEPGRDDMMERMLAVRYPTREQELADIEKRKAWNDSEGRKYEWGEMTTPNQLWVTYEVMNRVGYDVGDKLDIPYGVVKANTSGTGYSIENLKGEYAIIFGSSMTLDEAIDRIVYLAKLKRGDADISHPTQLFDFPATKSEMGESGRFRVIYGRDFKTREFDSKEEADAFASTKSGAYVSPIKEVKRWFGYKVRFIHPLTGEKMFVDDAEFDSKEEAKAYFDENFERINDTTNEKLQEERERKGEKKTLTPDDVVNVTMVKSSGGWSYAVVVDKKYANNNGMAHIIKDGFASSKDASAYADKVKNDIFNAIQKHKKEEKSVVFFDTGEDSRIGEDWRNGKDVEAEDFMNTFGFRGVQFGNWTNQEDRQMAINQAYDAFMDLASLIGVSPSALSLNGELGIAFGARGMGNASAHYEPNNVVINLTKTRGAGSLAHEWWHALDNYLARRAGKSLGMVTSNRSIEMREELRNAFNAMLDMVGNSDYAKRSAKKGDYWGRIEEVTARLLSEWVDNELKNNGKLNTFLSRGASIERYQKHNYNVYTALEKLSGREPMPFEEYKETPESLIGIPYPTAKEVEQFGASLRHIFNTLQEKVDEKTGKIALFHRLDGNTKPLDKRDAALRDVLIDDILRGAAGMEVITDAEGQRVLDEENLDDMRQQKVSGVRFFRTPNGHAYGFTMDGKIYIDTRIAGSDTPIHEYTHLWAEALRKANPKEWDNIVGLMKGSPLWEEVKKKYPDLKTDSEIADEVLAHYSGKRGAERLRKAQEEALKNGNGILEKTAAVAAINNVRTALKRFWKGVADFFGVHFNSAEEVADKVLSDMLNGVKPEVTGKTDTALAKEEADIIAKAKADGTYLRAPNGNPTNLAPRQWVQVRTKAFKKWFGDWEKRSRIEKLRKSESASITGEEIEITDDYKQNKKNAMEYGKRLQGEYTNADTGLSVQLQRGRRNGGIKEVLQHNYKDAAHLLSVAAIPQIIEKSVYIESEANNDTAKNPDVVEYQHFVCGLKIGNEDYTVHSLVAVDKHGNRYYDHNLTHIEKTKLLDSIERQAVKGQGFDTTSSTELTTLNGYKGKKLLEILQTNSSKVVDENGEPLVVYHGTTTPDITTFDLAKTRSGSAFWFANTEAHKGVFYSNQNDENLITMPLFINMRTPLLNDADSMESYATDETHDGGLILGKLKDLGFSEEEYQELLDKGLNDNSYLAAGNVTNPNQIKSATDNIGSFGSNPDIRYQFVGERGAESVAGNISNTDEDDDILYRSDDTLYRIREEAAPVNTGIGYKVFVLKNGELYPPMVANPNGEATPVGVWLNADAAPIAGQSKTGRNQVKAGGKGTQGGSGKLAYRPGWHLGVIPYALQFNRADETGERTLFPANFVWAEVEYANDVDYQEEAMSYGYNQNGKFQHSYAGLPRVPENGSYRYRTNPNPETDPWIITGAMRIKRLLTPTEVDEMVKAAGREPQRRQEGAITDEQITALNAEIANEYREGVGAYTDDEVSMENDPWSKMAGYNIRSKKERMAFAERERRRMVAAVTELAERLGIAGDVEIVTDLSGLQGRQRRAKGIYRKSSGKITIYIPNHINVADAVATFLHEAVAHRGLRNLFGKHFDEFLDKVYANSNSEIRSAIDALAKKKKLSTRTATEEYLAGLAEKTDFEHLPYNGWLQRVKTFFIEMLSKIGIKALDTTTLTDNELRFILWRSYRYMQGKDKGIIAFVEDTAMKMKLGVGYSEKEGASGAAEVAGKTEVSAKNTKNSARSVFDNLKKQQAFDKMFLFKVGDNYEILYEDAKSASEILGLPLQEKDGKEYVSFPVKDLDKNIALLVRGGAYVAVDNNPVQELFRDSATEVQRETDNSGSIEEVNERFNDAIDGLTEENKDRVTLSLGMPSPILIAAGVENKPLKLYGNKVIKKMKKHGFTLDELKDLPRAVADPIAVFNNIGRVGNRSILTELHTSQGNILVSVDLGKDADIDFNIVSSVFGKGATNVLDWINKGFATYINKEKARSFLSHQSAPIAAAAANEELVSAAKIIENFENPKIEGENSEEVDVEADELFREAAEVDRAKAATIYNNRIKSGMYQTYEAMLDSMAGLKEAMISVLKAEGGSIKYIEDVPDSENAYLGENRLSSVNEAECEAFHRTLFDPLLHEVANIAKTDKERRELTDYMMMKHGLERNAYMRKEATKRKEETDRDFAGLTTLLGIEDVYEAEAEAQRLVEEYEAGHNTDTLWKCVKDVTQATLRKSYECGIISKDTFYKTILMYDHYIPLRGFSDKTSSEEYTYLNHSESSFNAPIRTARGRSSKADDPILQMQLMAESAILQGNRNRFVKQRFLNFAERHPSDLISVRSVWLKYDDALEEWRPVFADINEYDTPEDALRKQEEFDERMEALAESDKEHFKNQSEHQEIPYRVVEKRDLREHQVLVKRGGIDYVLTINGSPRAAQAVNGKTNPDNGGDNAVDRVLEFCGNINRTLSMLYTTASPDFVVGNFARDCIYANTMVWAKEGAKYAAKFNANYAILSKPGRMKLLFEKYRKGKLDMSNERERLFLMFIKNGGETGFLRMGDIDQYRDKIKKKLRGINAKIPAGEMIASAATWVGEVGRAVETQARFAAFMTSIQAGRSIGRSIWDAKEISVNFNKKGAGDKFMGGADQTKVGNVSAFTSALGRCLYVFWNAGLQGTFNNFGKTLVRNPKKTIGVMAASFALGLIVSMLGKMAGDDDGDDNGDDEETDTFGYYDISKHIRRQNLVVKIPNTKSWFKLPLPIEFRAMYGMGELAGSTIFGGEPLSAGDMLAQVSQLAPIDAMEGWRTLIPSLAKPVADAYVNETWYGTPIYKDTPFNKYMPDWTKAPKNTNKYLVDLAETLNEMTGGDKYGKGKIDMNPARWEYLLRQYGGGIFTVASQLTSLYSVANGGKDADWRYVPLLNRFVMSSGDHKATPGLNERYFEIMDKLKSDDSRISAIKKDYAIGQEEQRKLIGEVENDEMYRTLKAFDEEYKARKEGLDYYQNIGDVENAKKTAREIKELKMRAVEYANKKEKEE